MRKNIWDEMRTMQDKMDSMFRSLMTGAGQLDRSGEGYDTPASDVWETDGEIRAEIELPGADKDDIQLEVNEDSIEVRADTGSEMEQKDQGVYRFERSRTGYYRKFALPARVDPETSIAKYENGVLRVTVKKTGDEDGGKKVKIQ